jgi:TPR repeat protein
LAPRADRAQHQSAQLPSTVKDITLRYVSEWREQAMVSPCLVFVRFFLVICLIGVCPVALASKADAAARVALVIGNGEYRYTKPLPNPVNDAHDIADTLEQLDFTVIRVFNGDFGNIREAIRAFNREVEKADIGLIYYAGHGMELGGENWIIPVDAELKTDRDLISEAIGLKMILQSVSRAGALGLVILDSCRDNPFAAKMTRTKLARSVDRGLARVEPTANVLVAYAAKDGTTATDGDGRNSPYTAALLKHLGTRGLEVSFVFRKVRDDVMTATSRRQQPFVYGSLSSKAIYLRAADPAAQAASAPAQPSAAAPAQPAAAAAPGTARNIDVAVWESINQSTDGALFENFLRQFPQSPRSGEAQARLAALRAGGECDQLRADIPRGARERAVTVVESPNAESLKPKPDPEAARRACETAMAAFPDVTRYALQGARAAEENKDYAKAREFYEKAADRGSRSAMVSLGALYESNLAGEPSYSKARSLYQKAVELGEPNAATRLARMYETGHGLGQSAAQAREWYRKAAALGDPQAMARLADIYQRGLGVRKNAAEARMWRRKIAEAKQAAAQPATQPSPASKPPTKKPDAN